MQKLQALLPPELAERIQMGWSQDVLREMLRVLLPADEFAAIVKGPKQDLEPIVVRKFLMRRVRIQVIEPFRGIEDREVEFTVGPGNCNFNFRENESYLIYAWRDEKTRQIETDVCSGTTRLSEATRQLSYIRGLRTGTSLSRISGFVTTDPLDMDFQFRASEPVVGVPVVVRSGDRSWRTVTDKEGKYELTGVAPGAYQVAVEAFDIPASQVQRTGSLLAGGCSRHNFLTVRVGSISGRLIDSNGKPISGVTTEIEAVPPTRQPRSAFQFLTDKDGRFEHVRLEAGEYIIGFNLTAPPNARDWHGKRIPYPGSYYPGVTDRADARVLRLGAGEVIQNLEFRVPPRAADRIVTGKLFWEDGSPAEADALLVDLDFPGDSKQVDGARAKPDGSFSLIGVQGRRYAIFAHSRIDERHVYSPVVEVRQESAKPIRLEIRDDSAEADCPICRRFKLRGQSPLW